MKTTINIAAKRALLIFALFSGLQVQLLMAHSVSAGPAKTTLDITTLAPVTPKEATFNDEATLNDNDNLPEARTYVNLAPVTPKEATFDDDDDYAGTGITNEFLREVAPVTPAFADFDDSVPDAAEDTVAVTFTIPMDADFTDF
jgi:hypothetical protein